MSAAVSEGTASAQRIVNVGKVQHTPGPWACDGISEYTGEMLVYAENGDRVARVCCYGPQSENPGAQISNALLIAAAPELLDALKVARQFISIDRTSLADCSVRPDGTFDPDDAAAVADYDTALALIDDAIEKATGGAA